MISASAVSRSIPFDPSGTTLTSRNLQDVVLELLNLKAAISLEKFTITQEHLDAGFIELDTTHFVANSLVVFIGRLAAFEDEDFFVTSNPDTANLRLTFTGNFAVDAPEAPVLGEQIRVTYWTI